MIKKHKNLDIDIPNINHNKIEKNIINRREFIKNTTLWIIWISFWNLLSNEVFWWEKIEKDFDEIEALKQKSFYEDYVKNFSWLYGDRLYTNKELLSPDYSPIIFWRGRLFRISPNVRLLQFFLRNNKKYTLDNAENLWCIHHETLMDKKHILTKLFSEAGIDIEWEKIDWVEVPNWLNGSIIRDGERYGGKDEILMSVEKYTPLLNELEQRSAQKAWYNIDPKLDFEWTIANEISHEIQNKYFNKLFNLKNLENLDEPFNSFICEIPDLIFHSNIQAGEFLSDVADWLNWGMYYRFFEPLFNILEIDMSINGNKNRYRYSYQVQKYAMKQVLTEKWFINPQYIINLLISKANKYNIINYEEVYFLARKFFQEEDLKKIAQIYRRIWIELLIKMKPYFSKKDYLKIREV